MTLHQIIKALQQASGSNAKQVILQQNKDNTLLKAYLKAVYDPAISYYQTKTLTYKNNMGYGFNSGTISALISTLANRELTGIQAKTWLDNLMKASNDESQELIQLLIKRSIGAGVGDSLILGVFPDLYFIPPYQRCSLLDEKIKAKFEKLNSFIIQEKLDGSFCYLVKEAGKAPEAITRAGSKYPTEFSEKLAKGLPDGFVAVGELLVYRPNYYERTLEPLSRKEGNGILNSILKRGEVDANLTFELTAWDCLTVNEWKEGKSSKPYHQRLDNLDEVISDMSNVRPITTHYVSKLEEAYKIYSKFTAQGLEGAVIKSKDFKWSSGTSKDCVKLKIEFEMDLQVISITEGTGKAKAMMGSITLKSSDGIIVTDCGSGFSDEDREEWWNNQDNRIGSIVTVKANDIITKRDSEIRSLFLPIYIEHRLDKSEADSYHKCVQQLEAAKRGNK